MDPSYSEGNVMFVTPSISPVALRESGRVEGEQWALNLRIIVEFIF